MSINTNNDIVVYLVSGDNRFHKKDCNCVKGKQIILQMGIDYAREKGHCFCPECCPEYVKETNNSISLNEYKNDISKIIRWIICILLVMLMCVGCFSMCKDFNEDVNEKRENKTYRCSSCDKVFTNNDDVKSIIYTSMCEPCYEDFKFIQEVQEEIKKYSERNQ